MQQAITATSRDAIGNHRGQPRRNDQSEQPAETHWPIPHRRGRREGGGGVGGGKVSEQMAVLAELNNSTIAYSPVSKQNQQDFCAEFGWVGFFVARFLYITGSNLNQPHEKLIAVGKSDQNRVFFNPSILGTYWGLVTLWDGWEQLLIHTLTNQLPMFVGSDYFDSPTELNDRRNPHLLILGTTVEWRVLKGGRTCHTKGILVATCCIYDDGIQLYI